MTDTEREVLAAVDAIIDDYAHHRRDAYFSGFATDATFVFHTSPHRLEDRAEYERLWQSWEEESGFRVVNCESSNRRLQLFGDIAVFSHDVDTTISFDGKLEDSAERETIVMARRDDGWSCIHEHLSGRD